MLHATEQQLQLITRRTEQLEGSVKLQVEEVKRLQAEKLQTAEVIAQLKRQLSAAEDQLATIDSELSRATQSLRSSATDFSKAQLLKKKYQNTLAELKGHCRAHVLMPFGLPDTVVVPDSCTVDVGDRATFVFDSVVVGEASPDNLGADQLVRDALEGYNTAVIGFGPSKSGKTASMFGVHGHARHVLQRLFDSMEELEVTHFNIRLSFGEVMMDQFTDHLADFGNVLAMGSATDIRSLPVQTSDDALRLLDMGLHRLGTAKRPVGHVFFALTIENFNRRGHFRKGSMLFLDLVGTPGPHVPRTPENQWIVKSVSSFCNTLSLLASGAQSESLPKQGGLLRLLQEALGGNCKTTLLTVIGNNSVDEALSALTYSHHFKSIVNTPTPYDIPAELQRLNLEAGLE